MNSFKTLLIVLSMFVVLSACETKNQESENEDVSEASSEEGSGSASKDLETAELINPNLASKEDMMNLLDESLIDQILEKRPFLSMTDLDDLLSISMDSAQKAQLYSKMFVPMNLNTTAEEDFKIIPGVGNRMAHEFEEYRPYTKIQLFRKEIGKYVDENEVARLEQYVFVPVELNSASEEDILALPGVGNRMAHEFEEYRPYQSMEQFRKEIGKYVDDKELARLERFVYLSDQ